MDFEALARYKKTASEGAGREAKMQWKYRLRTPTNNTSKNETAEKLLNRYHPFRGHDDALDRTVRVVVQIINRHRTTEAATIGDVAASVINKERTAFKFNNGLVIGIGVTRQLIKDALVLP